MLPKDVERFEAYRDHGVRDWVRNTLRGLTDRAAAGLTGIVLAKKKLEYDSISPCSQTNTPPSILLEPPFQPATGPRRAAYFPRIRYPIPKKTPKKTFLATL